MITAGIDVGAKNIKIVIVRDSQVSGWAVIPGGYDIRESLERAWAAARAAAGLPQERIERIVATGVGRRKVTEARDQVTEVSAAAAGAGALDDRVRTVIDVGAEESRAIKINGAGKVVDFAVNEKCAAGTGAFTEAMARALEVPLAELGPLSRQSARALVMNAQCVVFAESELVTMVHSQVPKADMARAVHDAIADRIASLVRRVGLEKEIMLIGGVARNEGLVESLERELETVLILPEIPEIVSASGAALLAGQ
ncbi:MAG: acyl-CoA dehydratase activase [Desulfobacterota bacterium]|jgi:benzoyl-CoA reductase subunit D|nr:acyl-CoA dehydratase activase [Thermodesulfobacteriota bacterium]